MASAVSEVASPQLASILAAVHSSSLSERARLKSCEYHFKVMTT